MTAVDQWAAEHPTTAPALDPFATVDSVRRVADLHNQIGPIPPEVIELLIALLRRQDCAALHVTEWLREIGGPA